MNIKLGVIAMIAAAGLAFDKSYAQQSTNPDEVRAVVAEMLSDAETRSSLLADAGHDSKGFMISGEGFTLRVGGQIQFRYLMNFRDNDNTAGIRGGDDFEPGFQTRRTKIWFSGNIINEKWKYKIVAPFSRSDGSLGLEDAWVSYDFGSGMYAKWGQFRLPYLHESLVSDAKQLTIERSQVEALFGQDWSQGVELGYKADAWRFAAAFSDGLGSRNTDFTSVAEADWALTGRVEFKVAGDNWDQFEDFTAEQGGKFGMLLGAAVHYQDGPVPNSNNPGDIDNQYLGYTFDISVEGGGWNAYGAFVGRHIDSRGPVGAGDNEDQDDFGLVVQGGVRVAANTELFARWDAIWLDEDVVGDDEDNFHFLTAGINQYYAGHAAKASADLVYCLSETDGLFGQGAGISNTGFPSSGLGLLGSTEENEIVLRFQFQLLF